MTGKQMKLPRAEVLVRGRKSTALTTDKILSNQACPYPENS